MTRGVEGSPGGGDGAPGATPASPASCAREDAARPAPATLFDAFTKDVAALDGEAKTARVDKLLADVAAQGGTPLEDPATGRVIYLARGAGPWGVTTSLVAFDPAQATPLSAVAGTDLWAVEATIPRAKSFEYKLVSGGALVEDDRARNLVWDGVDDMEPGGFDAGRFNAVGHAMDWPKDRGRIVRHGNVHATRLANDREVYVYLPARYDDGTCTTKLPSVIFQDGKQALTNGDFARAADTLYAARPELAAVLVFASNIGALDARNNEYSIADGTAGDDYVDFLVTDLWPKVTAAGYRLCASPAARGISGSSLGGLIASYAAFERPGQWGWVGAQSGSFTWDDEGIVSVASNAPNVGTRFYLDSGDDNVADVDLMAQTLTSKNYDFVRITQPGGQHVWSSWNERLGGMLTHFREGKTDCD